MQPVVAQQHVYANKKVGAGRREEWFERGGGGLCEGNLFPGTGVYGDTRQGRYASGAPKKMQRAHHTH